MYKPTFLGKKILFAFAHPDDESFTSAGTMIENRKLGGRNFLVCATFGEKGKAHLGRDITAKELAMMRKHELEQAAKFLKIDGLKFFGLPDTGLKDNLPILKSRLERLARQVKPDVLVSFGPDGVSGHLDHIAIGKAAISVAKKLRIPFVAIAAAPDVVKRFEQVKTRRRHGKYAAKVKHQKPNTKVPINTRPKVKVMGFHKSQFSVRPLADLRNLGKSYLGYEYFVQ